MESEHVGQLSHACCIALIPATLVDRYESGAKIARSTIHQQSQWPRGMIGPIDILWRGLDSSSIEKAESRRQVWLRLHPAMFEEAWSSLRDSLKFVQSSSPANIAKRVKIADLRGEIDCFEIMGPKAGLVLQGLTKVCKSENHIKRQVRGQRSLTPHESRRP